jgi:hypothetical protein
VLRHENLPPIETGKKFTDHPQKGPRLGHPRDAVSEDGCVVTARVCDVLLAGRLTDVRLRFEIGADEADPVRLARLVDTAERYCVNLQTLRNPPPITTEQA